MKTQCDERLIRNGDRIYGTFGIGQLYRMMTSGVLDCRTEFRSAATGEWHPIAGIMFDFDEPPNLPRLMAVGIRRVPIIGTSTARDDCAACAALLDRIFVIENAPVLPPDGCCAPWCRLLIVPAEDGADNRFTR